MFDRIAFVAQVQAQQFRDVGVVFDYQYASGRVHGKTRKGRCAYCRQSVRDQLSHLI
jgi:hypothetical protein